MAGSEGELPPPARVVGQTAQTLGLIGAAVAIMAGPSVVIITDLRMQAARLSMETARVSEQQVADHGHQAVGAVQQWCDAVIRELEREANNHRAYYLQQCPAVAPIVGVYVPPPPPWGSSAIESNR